jgi:hypothetical protein
MENQLVLNPNAEVARATKKCRIRMRFTLLQKQQALHCNAEVADASLQFRSSRHNTVMQNWEALHCNAKQKVLHGNAKVAE